MLSKITSIINVGVFRTGFWSDSSLEFKKINLLYGFNGSGKTMLSNTLRLFSADIDPDEIAKAMKASDSGELSVECLWDGSKAKAFSHTKKIQVFNAQFVSEHVYDGTASRVKRFRGDVTTNEQLKNPQIKKLEDGIADKESQRKGITDEISALKSISESIRKSLSSSWNNSIKGHRLPPGRGLDSDDVVPREAPQLSLEELDTQLKEHFHKYKLSQMSTELSDDLQSLKSLTPLQVTLQADPTAVLQKNLVRSTLDGIQQKIDELKTTKLDHCSVQDWFKDGVLLLNAFKDKLECPLCGSAISQIQEIIRSYNEFFNDEFTKLQKNLMELGSELQDIDATIITSEKALSLVKSIANKYSLFEKLTKPEQAALKGTDVNSIETSLKALQDLVTRKTGDLSSHLSESEIADALKFVKTFSNYALWLKSFDTATSHLITLLQESTFDVTAAKTTAQEFFWKSFDTDAASKAIAYKFDKEPGGQVRTSGLSFYRELMSREASLFNEIEQVKVQRNGLLVKLRDESKYVNQYLNALGVNNLQIKIGDKDGDDIEINYTSGCQKMGMMYSLSEGEKTALAFAYFLSKVTYEVIDNTAEHLGDYVIVIDDPVSSLDENRLFSTAILINRLFVKNAKQLFVFSHNLVFLKYLGCIIAPEDNKEREDFLLECGVISRLPKPLQNYQTSYFYKLQKVRDFAEGNIDYDSAKEFVPNYVRIVLEVFLSFKLCRLKGGSGNADRFRSAGLDKLIGTLSGCDLSGLKAVDSIKGKDDCVSFLWEIKKQVDPESHGTPQDLTEFEYISETDLRHCAKKCLVVIEYLDQIHYEKAKVLSESDPQGALASVN